MKKILPILVVVFLIGSTLGALAQNNDNSNEPIYQIKVNSSNIIVPNLKINSDNDNNLELGLEKTSTYLMKTGEPMLPKIVKKFELPTGVRNINVDVQIYNIKEKEISSQIRPGPVHLPLTTLEYDFTELKTKNAEIYSSNNPYPNEWFDYKIGVGLNSVLKRVTHVAVNIYPIKYIPASNKILIADTSNIEITYEEPINSPTTQIDEDYDLVIIAPKKFEKPLQKLIDHKNNLNPPVKTFLKTCEDIYSEFDGRDKPEQIKYFIKDAIDKNDITYVLLVGGLKNRFWAPARDNCNEGSKWWYVPVRYNNLFDDPEHPLSEDDIHDPGVITDLYYADVYREGDVFEDWDPNGDDIFGAWRKPGVENDTGLDMYPDVFLGRLACRTTKEVRDVVNKIIKYENEAYGSEWFNRVLSISGDGFLDQEDLDFQWDTNGLPDGEYTIKAQSKNPEEISGPIDKIEITLDRTKSTEITVNHDDHLKPEIQNGFPAPPITEIVSVSNGNILGYDDYTYEPGEGVCYCNSFNGWANVEYTDGILHIRGKSYDPKPYGNLTDVHLWVENSQEEIVFDDWRYDTEQYYEGEWVVGDRTLKGGGGALYYMDDFEKEFLWASNGKLTGQPDVIDAMSKGHGFVFMSGHGSPNTWGDHFPGAPGNRQGGSFTGLRVSGLRVWFKFVSFPILPMTKIMNKNKLPVVLIGGCHNSQFNVSMFKDIFDFSNAKYSWKHGSLVHECFSWYLVKVPKKGAIATIGNTGLGYGILGKDCLIGGLDGGICIEFFKQYGQYGQKVLGDAYGNTLITYLDTFDMEEDDHIKSVHQWVLLGDPSLKLGGYE